MEMTVDYLPIGTVVKLENDDKKLMITGYCMIPDDEPLDVYDYCSCKYPEGVESTTEIFVFDHDQIEEVLFIGYEDEEGKKYKEEFIKSIEDLYNDVENDSEDSEENSEEKEEIQPLISIESL